MKKKMGGQGDALPEEYIEGKKTKRELTRRTEEN